MPSFAQRSFAGGEIGPALYARADQAKYATGLRTCRNFIVQRFGGVTNRQGTEYLGEVKDSSQPARLLPFIFNDEQTHMIELGATPTGSYPAWVKGYMRIYTNGVRVQPSASAWVAGNYNVGDIVEDGGNFYSCVATASAGNAPGDPAFWYEMPAGVLEIPTPWAIAYDYILKYAQSADVIVVASQDNNPYQIERRGASDWAVVPMVWAPSIAAPTGTAASGGTGSGPSDYVVTAVAKDTLIESLASVEATDGNAATSGSPITVTWDAQAEAQEFVIYKKINGVFGLIGIAQGTSFRDTGLEPDTSLQPPIDRALPDITGMPRCVSFFQQRLAFGGSTTYPERVVMSRLGDYNNFGIHSPLQDDDAVNFDLIAGKVSEVRNILGIGRSLVVLTSSTEYTVQGSGDGGAITPSTIGAVPQSYAGCSWLDALPVNDTALFVQARGSIVRDLQYEFATDGYRGRDLTVYAQHLVDGYTIRDWDYAQTPNSVVWSCRSDGTLLGLTYVREHDVWGWHRHDTDGAYEQVAVIPEGESDAAYFVVKRTINGVIKRYIERLAPQEINDPLLDARFVDCHGYFDGRNTGSDTLTLSTSGGWTAGELLTLNASTSIFTAGDVGNSYHLTVGGDEVRCRVVSFTSGTVVEVLASKDVPSAFQSVALTSWAKGVDELSGLDWLEGKEVAVYADGFVLPRHTVTGGAITLGSPHTVIVVGLPIQADLETLNLELTNAETLIDKKKRVRSVTAYVQNSRGFLAGTRLDKLRETKERDSEGYDDPIQVKTKGIEINVQSTWNDDGRVVIRQDDPLPLTILSLIPKTFVSGS